MIKVDGIATQAQMLQAMDAPMLWRCCQDEPKYVGVWGDGSERCIVLCGSCAGNFQRAGNRVLRFAPHTEVSFKSVRVRRGSLPTIRWVGHDWRIAVIEQDRGGVRVWVVQQTKKGTDFKRKGWSDILVAHEHLDPKRRPDWTRTDPQLVARIIDIVEAAPESGSTYPQPAEQLPAASEAASEPTQQPPAPEGTPAQSEAAESTPEAAESTPEAAESTPEAAPQLALYPWEWERILGILVLGRDGWFRVVRHWPIRIWEERIIQDEFIARAVISTCEYTTPEVM